MKTQRIGHQPIRTSLSGLILGVIILSSCSSIPSTQYIIIPKEGSGTECVLRADQEAVINVIGNEISIETRG